MLNIEVITLNPFQENTCIIYDSKGNCAIIDPGCYDQREQNILKNFIEENGLTPVKLLNTHCHIDHIFGNRFVSETWNLPLYIHKEDLPTLAMGEPSAHIYNLHYDPSPEPTGFFEDGDIIKAGDLELKVLFTPGHAPGHVVFYLEKEKVIIGGDVLFSGSIGRTDLPGGNHNQLIKSIKEKILVLDDDITIYPGHGPETTIGAERRHNPFLT